MYLLTVLRFQQIADFGQQSKRFINSWCIRYPGVPSIRKVNERSSRHLPRRWGGCFLERGNVKIRGKLFCRNAFAFQYPIYNIQWKTDDLSAYGLPLFSLCHKKIPNTLCSGFGADDEARTRYLHLGKVALYRMSYIRNMVPPVGIEPTTRGFSVLCSTD